MAERRPRRRSVPLRSLSRMTSAQATQTITQIQRKRQAQLIEDDKFLSDLKTNINSFINSVGNTTKLNSARNELVSKNISKIQPRFRKAFSRFIDSAILNVKQNQSNLVTRLNSLRLSWLESKKNANKRAEQKEEKGQNASKDFANAERRSEQRREAERIISRLNAGEILDDAKVITFLDQKGNQAFNFFLNEGNVNFQREQSRQTNLLISKESKKKEVIPLTDIKKKLGVDERQAKKIQNVIAENVLKRQGGIKQIRTSVNEGQRFNQQELSKIGLNKSEVNEILNLQKKQTGIQDANFIKFTKFNFVNNLKRVENIYADAVNNPNPLFKSSVDKLFFPSQLKDFKKLSPLNRQTVLSFAIIKQAQKDLPSSGKVATLLRQTQQLDFDIKKLKNISPKLKQELAKINKNRLTVTDANNLIKLRSLNDAELKKILRSNNQSQFDKLNNWINSFNNFFFTSSENEQRKLKNLLALNVNGIVKTIKFQPRSRLTPLFDVLIEISKPLKILNYASTLADLNNKIQNNKSISFKDYTEYKSSTNDFLGIKSLSLTSLNKVRRNFNKSTLKGVLRTYIDVSRFVIASTVATVKIVVRDTAILLNLLKKLGVGVKNLGRDFVLDISDAISNQLKRIPKEERTKFFSRTVNNFKPVGTAVRTVKDLTGVLMKNPELLALGIGMVIANGQRGIRKTLINNPERAVGEVASFFVLSALLTKGIRGVAVLTKATLKLTSKIPKAVKSSKLFLALNKNLPVIFQKLDKRFNFPKQVQLIVRKLQKSKTVKFRGTKIIVAKNPENALFYGFTSTVDKTGKPAMLGTNGFVKRNNALQETRNLLQSFWKTNGKLDLSKLDKLEKVSRALSRKFKPFKIFNLADFNKLNSRVLNLFRRFKNVKRITFRGTKIALGREPSTGLFRAVAGTSGKDGKGIAIFSKQFISPSKALKDIKQSLLKFWRTNGKLKLALGDRIQELSRKFKPFKIFSEADFKKLNLIVRNFFRGKKGKTIIFRNTKIIVGKDELNFFRAVSGTSGKNGFSAVLSSKRFVKRADALKDMKKQLLNFWRKNGKLDLTVKDRFDNLVSKFKSFTISKISDFKRLNLRVKSFFRGSKSRILNFRGTNIAVGKDELNLFRAVAGTSGKNGAAIVLSSKRFLRPANAIKDLKKQLLAFWKTNGKLDSALLKKLKSFKEFKIKDLNFKQNVRKMLRSKKGQRPLLLQKQKTRLINVIEQRKKILVQNMKRLSPEVLGKKAFSSLIKNLGNLFFLLSKLQLFIRLVNFNQLRVRSIDLTNVLNRLKLNTRERQILASLSELKTLTSLEAKLKSPLKTNLELAKKLLTLFKVPKLPIKEKPLKKIRIPIRFSWTAKLKRGEVRLVNGLVKVRGKIKEIRLRTTANRGLKFMITLVDRSTARSFQLKIVGIVKRKDIKQPSLRKFRKKKPTNKPVLTFVERTQFTIDSPQEKRALRLSKLARRSSKKPKKRKGKKKSKPKKKTKVKSKKPKKRKKR